MTLQDSINDNPAAGDATGVESFLFDCTIIGRAMRHAKLLRFPELFVVAWFWKSSLRSDMTSAKDMSIAIGWDCIAMIFSSVGKMLRIYQSMYDFWIDSSNARLATKPNHDRVCSSSKHIFRYTKHCRALLDWRESSMTGPSQVRHRNACSARTMSCWQSSGGHPLSINSSMCVAFQV